MDFLLDNLLGFLTTLVFGVVITTLLFFVTAPVTDPRKLAKYLCNSVKDELHDRTGTDGGLPTIDTFFSERVDIAASESLFLVGTWETNASIVYRWFAIFQQASQGLLDRLIGRSPGLVLIQLAFIRISESGVSRFTSRSVFADGIRAVDLDGDGNKEVLVELRSEWADSVAVGLLIWKYSFNQGWLARSLPPLSALARSVISNEVPDRSIKWFPSPPSEPSLTENDLADLSLFEDTWQLEFSGKQVKISMFRQGRMLIDKHPITAKYHIGIACNIFDLRGFVSTHHVLVWFFSLAGSSHLLEPDSDWNFGIPCISAEPIALGLVSLEDQQRIGANVHVIGTTWFGGRE